MKKEWKMNVNPWEQAVAYFWYNDAEIFEYTQEDFDRRAQAFAERGVTLVETFSFTHFRLGFYPYWKAIWECIRKIVIACHKYGIRVVEHHSSNLTHNLRTKSGWKRFGESMLSYANGTGSYDNWYKTLEFLTADYIIDGTDIRSFVQIDGSTGKPAENCYGAYSMCFNNPDYRRVYFDYVRDVVKTGIDGIMNDDIQFFGERNACACPCCKKLFYEQTGYTLPDPDGWSSFFENYDNPAYIAWKKFKFESTTRMYRDLAVLYDEMGVKLLRPNYCSDVLKHNPTCYSFERCTDLWDFIEQENCFSAIIKQSYMDFYTEAVHRYAAASRHNVPSVSMFYPDRSDSTYFAWALARSWGQLYTGTCEGYDITEFEKPYRLFEEKYRAFFTAPRKHADLSFYCSFKSRDNMADAFRRYTSKFMADMQAAYVSGFTVDMVMEDDSLAELAKHPVIVASHTPVMSDTELEKLSAYVKSGGELIILGEFATRREDGSMRLQPEIFRLVGADLPYNVPVFLENGKIWRMDYETPDDAYQPTIWAGRKGRTMEADMAVPSKWELQKKGTGAVLSRIITEPHVRIDSENDRILGSLFSVYKGYLIQLINLRDTISLTTEPVSHDDIISNFVENAPKNKGIRLTVRLAGKDAAAISSVRLCTPECVLEREMNYSASGSVLEIAIPDGVFSGYAMLMLT